VAAAFKPLDALLKNPLANLSRRPELGLKMHCSTTSNHLRMTVCRVDADARQADAELPAIAGNPPVAIWVHQSMVARMLSDPTLREALQPLVGRMMNQNKLVPVSAQRGKPAVKVRWSGDGSWLTVTFGAKQQQQTPAPRQPFTLATAGN
jgi:hypothetical protein